MSRLLYTLIGSTLASGAAVVYLYTRLRELEELSERLDKEIHNISNVLGTSSVEFVRLIDQVSSNISTHEKFVTDNTTTFQEYDKRIQENHTRCNTIHYNIEDLKSEVKFAFKHLTNNAVTKTEVKNMINDAVFQECIDTSSEDTDNLEQSSNDELTEGENIENN